MISISFDGCKGSTIRGYWKFNNSLLSDSCFVEQVKLLANIFAHNHLNYTQKWEPFKFNVRVIATRRGKELKKNKLRKITEITDQLNTLIKQTTLSEDEKSKLYLLNLEIDQLYIELAKGAYVRSRAKWFEEGERNISYFFSMEKNIQETISSLKINERISSNLSDIASFAYSFYEKLYTSHSDNEKISTFLQTVKHFVPIVSNDYCEDDISKAEISKALFSMKKGKSPGSDGLTIELYCAFWDLIENPLFSMYKECLEQKEMSSTMKQGVISLILKPDNDSLIIDNWRPITLLNVDYNMLALIYGTRLKSGLSNIIGES